MLITGHSDRDRDTKMDDRDRDDRDRRENGANGDDRKRTFSFSKPASPDSISNTHHAAIDSPDRPAHDDLDVAE
jgi:hypothetical protein